MWHLFKRCGIPTTACLFKRCDVKYICHRYWCDSKKCNVILFLQESAEKSVTSFKGALKRCNVVQDVTIQSVTSFTDVTNLVKWKWARRPEEREDRVTKTMSELNLSRDALTWRLWRRQQYPEIKWFVVLSYINGLIIRKSQTHLTCLSHYS